MDKIEALGSSIAQISLYDLKSYYNQAKAVVLNYTEMEAKVRDATNDDAWGASSTLMQEIAQGTFNFQQFNEIMPTIYKRFTEKEAREWRQIYKALQLLEYLIKHGSERVIDDARSHISMIKILKNFHYVDEKGKDQGINVRNRAKEIAELLSDLDKVRQERRKAKASRSKYTGVGNDGLQFTTATGSKYGGFGSESGGFSGGGGGDDWNGGESSSRDRYGGGGSTFKQGDDFEEYDAGEWEDRPAPSTSRPPPPVARGGLSSTRRSSITVSMKKSPEKAAPPPKAKEVDLFSMADEDDFVAAPPANSSKAAQPQSLSASVSLDDDFDDFQSAPPANTFGTTAPPASVPQSGAKPNVFALLNSTPPASASSSHGLMGNMAGFSSPGSQPPSLAAAGSGGQFSSAMFQPTAMNNGMKMTPAAQAGRPGPGQAGASNAAAGPPAKAAGGAAFDDLFSFAGLSSGSSSAGTAGAKTAPAAKLSMAAMAREQSSASIWGAGAGGPSAGGARPAGMGSMGAAGMAGNNTGAMGNNDDLLL